MDHVPGEDRKRKRSRDEAEGQRDDQGNNPSAQTDPAEGAGILTLADLNPFDVLLGRGSQVNQYKGNIHFRSLVRERKDDYSSTTRRHMKDLIARQIFSAVSSKQGRFLRKVDNSDPNGNWVVIDDEVAIEKVKQTLRDQEKNDSHDVTVTANSEAKQGSATPLQAASYVVSSSAAGNVVEGYAAMSRAASLSNQHIGSTESYSLEDQASAQRILDRDSLQAPFGRSLPNIPPDESTLFASASLRPGSEQPPFTNANALAHRIFLLQQQRQRSQQEELLRAIAGVNQTPSGPYPFQSNLARALQVSNLRNSLLSNNLDNLARLQLGLSFPSQRFPSQVHGMSALSQLHAMQGFQSLDRSAAIRQLMLSGNQHGQNFPDILASLEMAGESSFNPDGSARSSTLNNISDFSITAHPPQPQETSEMKTADSTGRLSFVGMSNIDAVTSLVRSEDIAKQDDSSDSDTRNETRELGKSDDE